MPRKTSIETPAYANMMRRMINTWVARAGDGDPDDLAELLAATRQVDQGLRIAINTQRATYGTTWAQIAAAAGMTKQGAQQRWGESTEGNTPCVS